MRLAVTSDPVTLSLFLFFFLLLLTSAPEANAHAEKREFSLSRVQLSQRGATRVDNTPVRLVLAIGRPTALEPVEIGGGALPAYALALSHAGTNRSARATEE